MKDRVLLYMDYLRTSFWVIPVGLMLIFSGLAFFNIWLDSHVFPSLQINLDKWIDLTSVEGIRSTLTTTAAAILGVAGVSFSITIASLTLASQQFGPRLIRTFLQDRFTQTVLGFFVATFLYCMLSVHLSSIVVSEHYVPLSLLITVLSLTLIDLVLLVLFIHHISVSIQVNSVVNEVAKDMQIRAATMFENSIEDETTHEIEKDQKNLEHLLSGEVDHIRSQADGYIQLIDYEELAEHCEKYSVVMRVPLRAGDHVLLGQVIATVSKALEETKNLESVINTSFVTGSTRNPQQDLEFAIRQLVEIGLRALSPGINDPFTTMTCIDHLSVLINFMIKRRLRPPVIHDPKGMPRLLVDVSSFEGIICSAFSQLRQNASGNVDVILHLLDTLSELIIQSRNRDQALPLLKQAKWTVEGANTDQLITSDLDAIHERFDNLSVNFNEKFTKSD